MARAAAAQNEMREPLPSRRLPLAVAALVAPTALVLAGAVAAGWIHLKFLSRVINPIAVNLPRPSPWMGWLHKKSP